VPFEVKVESEATLKQLDELIKNVAELSQTELTTTFTAWQADDMHRKFPKVDGSGASVSTTIYPRSRLTRTKNLAGGKSTLHRSIVAASRPGAHRPILRPELFDQLKQRMMAMLKEAAKWH